jgi:hypothetical protein
MITQGSEDFKSSENILCDNIMVHACHHASPSPQNIKIRSES